MNNDNIKHIATQFVSLDLKYKALWAELKAMRGERQELYKMIKDYMAMHEIEKFDVSTEEGTNVHFMGKEKKVRKAAKLSEIIVAASEELENDDVENVLKRLQKELGIEDRKVEIKYNMRQVTRF